MAIGFNQPVNYGGRTMGPANVDPRSRQMRMREWESYVAQNPGAGEGGTGSTGLTSADHSGWSWILDKRKQYADDQAALQGKGPLPVRMAGYDGTTGVLAPRKGSSMPGGALKGLSSAIDGGREDRLPQWLTDDPAMYDAFKDSQLRGFQAKSNAADPNMGDYLDLRGRRLYGVEQEGMDREAEYADAIARSEATSDNYWRRGEPIARRQNELAADLAREKGIAAGYDDQIRADASRYGADSRLTGTRETNLSREEIASLQALERSLRGQQQYGEPGDPRAGRLAGQLDERLAGGGGGSAPAAGGKKYIEGKTYEKNGQRFVYRNGKMVPK